MPRQATQIMAEVFGFPTDNFNSVAENYRRDRLCPFNNRVPNCTKDKAKDPLGVCSIYEGNGNIAITCPVRFRQDWQIASDAAQFFFPTGSKWTSLVEVPLKDKNGQSAGNIDVVLVAYNEQGQITDFGAVEVQAVYISGNIRDPFSQYIQNPQLEANRQWLGKLARPDYLSSSRKRLAPQLLFKGGILKSWNKKMAVAIQSSFYNTLPHLQEVEPAQAEIAWLLYDLSFEEGQNRYNLTKTRVVYTSFDNALDRITKPEVGEVSHFVATLQKRLDSRLSVAPSAPVLGNEEETEEYDLNDEEGLA